MYYPGMVRVSLVLDTQTMPLYAMPKDGQGSFTSKCCHDNYLYYVHPKNGMVSLDMSVLRSTVQFESIVSFYRFSSSEW